MLVLRIFVAGLDDKISFEKLKQKADLWLNEPGNIKIIDVDHIKVIKYLKRTPSELVSPIRSAISKVVDDNGITAILSFDDKIPDILTLFRTNFGHDNIDLSKSNPSETIFNHQGGFFMKFKPSDENEWIRLIRESI